MNTISKVLTAALALGSAVALGGTANAQDWRGGYGNGNGMCDTISLPLAQV